MPSPWYARVQAATYNPNLLASFCIFASAVVTRRESELPVWLRRIAVCALWITVCLTFSRGILGFVLAATMRGAGTPRRRRVTVVCGLVLAGTIMGLTLANPSINPARPLELHFMNAHSSRYQAASSSLVTVMRHPLFGNGLGTSPGEYLGQPMDAHLTPINIAGTLGLPALVAFSSLLVLLWRGRRRPLDMALWGGFAGLTLDALALDVEDFRHVWVLLGLAAADASGVDGRAIDG